MLAIGDRLVVREAGRRETVAGGLVLDIAPGKASRAPERLEARLAADPADLPALLVRERGAVPVSEVALLVGAPPPASDVIGSWAVDPEVRAAWRRAIADRLTAFHEREPLAVGAPIGDVRSVVAGALRASGAPTEAGLVEVALDDAVATGDVERTATSVRLAGHRVSLDADDPAVRRLLDAIGGGHEATPPTLAELAAAGIARDVVEAAVAGGLAVRVSKDLVFTPSIVARAEAVARGGDERHHRQRLPRGAGHEPQVRASTARASRPHRRHPP